MIYSRKIVNKILASTFEKILSDCDVDYKVIGSEFRISCPFHEDSTPSCYANTDLMVFHCFGCNESGDLVKLIAKIKNKSVSNVIREFWGSDGKINYPKSLLEVNKVKINKRRYLRGMIVARLNMLCDIYRFLYYLAMNFNGLSYIYKILYEIEDLIEINEYNLCNLKDRKCSKIQ